MMPPLLAVVEIQRKSDGHTFRIWLPLFLVWLLLLPIVLLVSPVAIVGALIGRIDLLAAVRGFLHLLHASIGTHVDIDQAHRHVVIRFV